MKKIHSGKIIKSLLKGGISIGLITIILLETNLSEIVSSILTANPLLLLIAFSLNCAGFFISAFRWRLLLRSRGSDSTILFLIKSYAIAMFFNNILPSTIGGDIYRAYDSYRLGLNRLNALAVVFIDRFFGLLALFLFVLLALFQPNKLTASLDSFRLVFLAGFVMILGVVWILFFSPRQMWDYLYSLHIPFSVRIQRIANAFLAFKGQNKILLQALALSGLLQANVIVHYYLIARALSLTIPFASFFFFIPIVIILTMFPVSVNGIGIREGGFVFFLGLFAVSNSEAVAFAWIGYGMIVIQGLIGGVVFAMSRVHHQVSKDVASN